MIAIGAGDAGFSIGFQRYPGLAQRLIVVVMIQIQLPVCSLVDGNQLQLT